LPPVGRGAGFHSGKILPRRARIALSVVAACRLHDVFEPWRKFLTIACGVKKCSGLDRQRRATSCRESQVIIHTAWELQEEGKFATLFSDDPKNELNTLVQWAPWANVATKEGKPVAKNDLAKKVYEHAGATAEEQKTQLQTGIENI
jgi:hypothetical protein